MILLTDYAALEASYKNPARADMMDRHCPLSYKRVAKAQLKKVLKEAKAKDISNTFRLALLEECR